MQEHFLRLKPRPTRHNTSLFFDLPEFTFESLVNRYKACNCNSVFSTLTRRVSWQTLPLFILVLTSQKIKKKKTKLRTCWKVVGVPKACTNATQWETCRAHTHTPCFLSLYMPGTKYLVSKTLFSLHPCEMVKSYYTRKNYSVLLLIPEATCYIPFYYL